VSRQGRLPRATARQARAIGGTPGLLHRRSWPHGGAVVSGRV